MAAGDVVAFTGALVFSAAAAAAGAYLCRMRINKSRRLLKRGECTAARILEVVPHHPAGQAFPADSARIVVEFRLCGSVRRETIVLARTGEERYRVGDSIEVLCGAGRPPLARTRDEPNIAYGTAEQITGAILIILAALPVFIMLSVHALTP